MTTAKPLSTGPALFALLAAGAFAAALASATGSLLIAGLIAGLLATLVLMANPGLLIWAILVGGLVISGLTELYLPGLRHFRWGVALSSLLLALVVLLSAAAGPRAAPARKVSAGGTPWRRLALAAAGLYFGLALVSTLANWSGTLGAVAGIKNYFQAWGLLLALAMLPLGWRQIDRQALGLYWLGLLQVPFALHQFFVLVPQRASDALVRQLVVAPDVVVGTFIGSMYGGGGSAILAMLETVAFAGVVACWQRGGLRGSVAALSGLVLLVPLLLCEAKVLVIFLPVAMAIVFQRTIRRRPLNFIAGNVAVLALLGLIFLAYTLLPRGAGQQVKSPEQYIQQTIDYNFGDRGYGGSRLNRSTVYPFWLERHGMTDLVGTLIGHGPGAAKEGGITPEPTYAARNYPNWGIGLTGISSLLWEVGLLGCLAALAMLAALFCHAGALLRQADALAPRQYALVMGARVTVALTAISLLHNNFFVFEIGFQTLFALIAGYLLHLGKRLHHA